MQLESAHTPHKKMGQNTRFFVTLYRTLEKEALLNLSHRLLTFHPLFRTALVGAVLWLILRWLLPWLFPLLAACALAAALEKPVRWLCRLGLSRGAAAGAVFTGFTVLLCAGAGLVGWWLTAGGLELLERLPLLLDGTQDWIGSLKDAGGRALVGAPVPLQEPLRQAMEGGIEAMGDLLSTAATQSALALGRWASGLPNLAFSAGTALLAGAFLSADRETVRSFFRRQLSPAHLEKWDAACAALRSAFGGWLKVQGTLFLLNGVLFTVGLCVLKVQGALLWALLIALVDLLPVLGSGAVLLPWAVLSFFWGKGGMALGLAVLWAAAALLRAVLEPRLVGQRAGLPPLAALAALYLGFTAGGASGMILAPLAVLSLKVLHDEKIVSFWR